MAREHMTTVHCIEREMGASLFKDRCVLTPVAVTGVRFQDATQMRLAQDNHMIDALSPDRANQPFSKAILPG
jgi:hypothetical protein